MAIKNVIVLSGNTHAPAGNTDTLPPGVIPVSGNSSNMITKHSDGLFVPRQTASITWTARYAPQMSASSIPPSLVYGDGLYYLGAPSQWLEVNLNGQLGVIPWFQL